MVITHTLKIELHDRLWEDYIGELTETLDNLQLTAQDNLISVECFGIPMVTLGYEQHLIYQIFHIAKHFSFEGLPLRYLTDLTLYVNSYAHQINYEHFWLVMEQLKYAVFCDAIFKICNQYLGMCSDILSPFHTKYPLNQQLLEDIILAGRTENATSEAWASTDMLVAYFMRNNKYIASPTKHKLQILFPSSADLKDKFSYAKKHKFLLPVAWIHRFFSALQYSILCRKKGISAAQVLNKAEYKLSLMAQVGLVDIE